jgi:hypothetical protein
MWCHIPEGDIPQVTTSSQNYFVEYRCIAMTDVALFVSQDVADLETMQGPGSDVCSAPNDGCYAISIKTEDVSDLEEEEEEEKEEKEEEEEEEEEEKEEEDEDEEDLAPIPFLGIKAEPEVSWVSVSRLSGQPSFDNHVTYREPRKVWKGESLSRGLEITRGWRRTI